MKTVKFKELPKKVISFLMRDVGLFYQDDYKIELDWLHTLREWSKATDEERLAYAEWRYRKGVSYSPIRGGVGNVVSGGEMSIVGGGIIHETENGSSIVNSAQHYNLIYTDGNWAEIISEPEKKHRPIKCSPQVNPEPEIKAGDEVEVSDDGEKWVTGVFIIYVNNIPFIQKDAYTLIGYNHIRKPDPDKELRGIAKEIMKSDELFEWKSKENTFTNLSMNEIESMLIEALKKGKEL